MNKETFWRFLHGAGIGFFIAIALEFVQKGWYWLGFFVIVGIILIDRMIQDEEF